MPAALTLRSVRVPPVVDPAVANPSPFGYTLSLLLFIVPIVVIALWFLPQENVHVSRRSFLWTIGLLFPLGALMDFFFADIFFTFSNATVIIYETVRSWKTFGRSARRAFLGDRQRREP
ncbi:MAG TPA: hypothetical protein VGC07_06790 [Granulicella sp.]